jgi:hypothetical protein
MTRESKSPVAPALTTLLSGRGFAKRSNYWWDEGDICFIIILITRSSWDNSYDIDCGFHMKILSKDLPTKAEWTHVRFRMRRIIPTNLPPKFDALLDGDRSFSDRERTDELGRILEPALASLRVCASDLAVLKTLLKRPLLNVAVLRQAQALFAE